MKPMSNGTNGVDGHGATTINDDDDDPNAQLEMESRGAAGARTSAGSAGVFSGKEDVEMQ